MKKKTVLLSMLTVLSIFAILASYSEPTYAKVTDNLHDIDSMMGVLDQLSDGKGDTQLDMIQTTDGGYVTVGMHTKIEKEIRLRNCVYAEDMQYGGANKNMGFMGTCDLIFDGTLYQRGFSYFDDANDEAVLTEDTASDIFDDLNEIEQENKLMVFNADDEQIFEIINNDVVFTSVGIDTNNNYYVSAISNSVFQSRATKTASLQDNIVGGRDVECGSVIKYDAEGNLLDSINLCNNDESQESGLLEASYNEYKMPLRIDVSPDGSFVVVGIQNIMEDGENSVVAGFVEKYDQDLDYEWEKVFRPSAQMDEGLVFLADVEILSDGGIAIAGVKVGMNDNFYADFNFNYLGDENNGICDFLCVISNAEGDENLLIESMLVKLNSVGQIEWKQMDAEHYGAYLSVHELADGSIVAGGMELHEHEFQSNLTKYSQSGTEIWDSFWRDEENDSLLDCIFDFIELDNGSLYSVGLSYRDRVELDMNGLMNYFDGYRGEPRMLDWTGDFTGFPRKDMAVIFSANGDYESHENLKDRANGLKVVKSANNNIKVLNMNLYEAKGYTPVIHTTPMSEIITVNIPAPEPEEEEEEEEEIGVPDTGKSEQEKVQIIVGTISATIILAATGFAVSKYSHQRIKHCRNIRKFGK